jgi:hypothetical protein
LSDKYLGMVSDAAMSVPKEYYPLAKRSLIELETRERIKALAALTDLRDVLDHLYRATRIATSDVEEGQKEKLVYAEIVSASEHLRRATIEPLETAVEDLLAKIIEKAKYNYVLIAIRISKVPNEEITKKLEAARKALTEVRMQKGEINRLDSTVKLLEKQQEDLRDLDSRLPTKITTKILFGFLVFFIGGFLVGWVSKLFV